MKLTTVLLGLSVGLFSYAGLAPQAKSARKAEVDFDRDVRPILSEHCYKCHGPDAAKAAAGLRLDISDGPIKHGVIVPKSPSKSRLLNRVSEKNPAYRMPPADSGVKPLTEAQIKILRAWIAAGAKYEKHWSYIPPKMPALPAVSNPKWCRNLIDRFVLAKLDEEGLKPEPEADKDTLAMRAAQTLTGLPPSAALLREFREDTQPGAYERFVDKLLASPEYGEHEARYWLDAVRYGDTHGLQLDNERGVYPYRDWVVRAFNQDLPFTKFVLWQLAGDLLPNPTTEQLIATGYVRMNLTSNEGGAIPEEFLARNTFDRVETTSTVMLGMTMTCARCHDHKYDPIKQKDYFGLYAFFNSTADAPLDGNITLPPPFMKAPTPEQETQLKGLTAQINALRDAVDLKTVEQAFDSRKTPVLSGRNWQISPVYQATNFDEAFERIEAPESGKVDWKAFDFVPGKASAGIIGKNNASVYVRGTVTSPEEAYVTLGISSDDAVKVWLNGKLIHALKVGRGVDQAIDNVTGHFIKGDNELLVKVVNGVSLDGLNIRLEDQTSKLISDALNAYRTKPTPATQQALQHLYLLFGPATPDQNKYLELTKVRSDLEAMIPNTLIAQELPKPRPTNILKRGLYDQKGEAVGRHVPASLGAMPANAPKNRLGLAQWLTSPTNPLFARVFVNRVWQKHFGVGIVKTPEDFGNQGEWPVNGPLLDYLSVSFVKNGWSVKQLNRLIVTSATFRQSSKVTPKKLSQDPENRYISRGPRYRMDAEVIRDKALYAGGLLVQKLGGRGFKPYQPDGIWENASDPASSTHIYVRDHGTEIYRRSLYMFWKRTAPPPSMLTFDAPLRDTCIVRRPITNTPLQALAMQNDPAFLEAARTMAQGLLEKPGTDAQRLKIAFELTLGRSPSPTEISILNKAISMFRTRYSQDVDAAKKLLAVGDMPQAKDLDPAEQAVWMLVCSTLMNTDEFLSIH